MEILDLKSTVTDFLKEFLMVATMKSSTVENFLKKKKNRATILLAIPFLSMHLEKTIL